MKLTLRRGYGNFRLSGNYIHYDFFIPQPGPNDGQVAGGYVDFTTRPNTQKNMLSDNASAQLKPYEERTMVIIYSDYVV